MTREEAHEILQAETRSSCSESFMWDFIDCAQAFGMLKLDEQKSAEDRFWELMEVYVSRQNLPALREEWAEHHLKIVEK